MTDELPDLAGLFGETVTVAARPVEDRSAELHAAELEELGTAARVRRAEYSSGRVLARELLGSLGAPNAPVLARDDGLPLWPEGFVASISHKRTACVVAAARADSLRSVGVDLEDAEPLAERLWERICRPAERAWLAGLDDGSRSLRARLVFSAKECTYKCLYPIIGVVLNFQDVELELPRTGSRGTFRARVLRDVPGTFPELLEGRFVLGSRWVSCGMELR